MNRQKLHHSNKRYSVWFRQGEYDLQAAEMSVKAGFNEWATFQAVQAVEKGLKAIIVSAGINPPRIHKLQTLIGICNRICPEFRDTKFEFRYLESFTFISRYPFLLPGKGETPHDLIKPEEAAKAIEQAKELLGIIKNILGHEAEMEGEELGEAEIFSQEEIEARIKQIVEEIKSVFDPERILLFGRFAREKEVSRLSTMDVLIIANTELSFVERIHKARQATRGDLPIIEPIVYTPAEFKAMVEDESEGFLENALREGREIYVR